MQPDPTPGTVEIMPLVIADLMARREQGIKTYGRPLQANNGRNPLWDAYEESLDQTCYLRQALEESPICLSCHHCETMEGKEIGECEIKRENVDPWNTCDMHEFKR